MPGTAVYTLVAVLMPSCPVEAEAAKSGSNGSSVILTFGTGSPIAEHFNVNWRDWHAYVKSVCIVSYVTFSVYVVYFWVAVLTQLDPE